MGKTPDIVKEAVIAERERCAGIALQMAYEKVRSPSRNGSTEQLFDAIDASCKKRSFDIASAILDADD